MSINLSKGQRVNLAKEKSDNNKVKQEQEPKGRGKAEFEANTAGNRQTELKNEKIKSLEKKQTTCKVLFTIGFMLIGVIITYVGHVCAKPFTWDLDQSGSFQMVLMGVLEIIGLILGFGAGGLVGLIIGMIVGCLLGALIAWLFTSIIGGIIVTISLGVIGFFVGKSVADKMYY